VLSFPSAGKDIRLNQLYENNLVEKQLVEEIIEAARIHENSCGVQLGLIVFDHARLVMTGDPLDANHVTQLTRLLTKIASATGAAVLLLGHSPKGVIGKENAADASEIFGSTAFVDNARTAFVLNTMRENEAKELGISNSDRSNYVCLNVVKANYGKSNVSWWFEKTVLPDWEAVVLKPVTLFKRSLFPNHNQLTDRILGKVRQEPAQLTERKLRDLSGKSGELKATEAEVKRTLNRLVQEGILVKRPPTASERKLHRISQNIKEVFDVVE
jgi:hypothetical protein